MLSPVIMRGSEGLGRLLTKNLWFFVKVKIKNNDFSDEKVKVMLLAAEALHLHAEVMPL